MVTTICWSTDNRVDYALEGVIVTCGATIAWLKNQLGLIAQSAQTEAMAQAVENSNGVCLIPAFSGMGTPHWRMDIKAAIMGLTFDCTKNHLVRAALESMVFQIKDVVDTMISQSGVVLEALKVDGGISANGFVMQFLADLLNIKVFPNGIEEVSALGAAYLAGLHAGVYESFEQLSGLQKNKKVFQAGTNINDAQNAYSQWRDYVKILTR
jgi:glycerol kinase